MNEFKDEIFYGKDDGYEDIIITDEYGREVGRYSGSAAKLKFPLKLKQSDIKIISEPFSEVYYKEYIPQSKMTPKPEPKPIIESTRPIFSVDHLVGED